MHDGDGNDNDGGNSHDDDGHEIGDVLDNEIIVQQSIGRCNDIDSDSSA